MRASRDFYIPRGSLKVADKNSSGVAYLYERNGVLYALAFHGRAQKPDWHFRFRSADDRAVRVAKHFENLQARDAAKKTYKQSRQQPRKLKVGDILRASWGYDQTNIDYYQVTTLVGERMVELREIARTEVNETGFMQGTCRPDRDNFVGPVLRRKVSYGDSVKIDSVRRAFPWSGGADHWTAYA